MTGNYHLRKKPNLSFLSLNTDESEDENEEDMFTELISQLQIDPDSMSELLSGQGEFDLPVQIFSSKSKFLWVFSTIFKN